MREPMSSGGKWIRALMGCIGLVGAVLPGACADTATHVTVEPTREHRVIYTSGKTVYVEALLGDRWVGRYWSLTGRIGRSARPSDRDTFEIRVQLEPSDASVPGMLLSRGWEWVAADELPRTDRGARHFVVRLSNRFAPIDLRVHTLLDGTPVLTRWLEITNTSETPVALTAVSPWSGRLIIRRGERPVEATLGYFTRDDWAHEGWLEWERLQPGTKTITCDQGRSHDDPFFILRNDASGDYFIGHLAWTTQWRMEFERADSGVLFRTGPWAETALRVIAPGETITTPAVHLGHVSGDLDSAVQAMHDHLRHSVLPRCKPEPSHLIHYILPSDIGYYQGDAFNEANVFKCVEVAAAVGAEVFIPCGPGWSDVLFDLTHSPSRFPCGLEPIIDYVHQKGMLFGLYAEPEGGRGNIGDSKVAQEHPDWLGPNDTLNLTIPEAAAWMESELCRLIEQYKLDLLWIDYNPSFKFGATLRDGFKENDCWRYYEACYRIYEHIRKKYPDLILLQAAGGGGRNDLGTASRFHETYLTDGLWTPNVFQVYSGQTLALPPEILTIGLGIFASAEAPDPANLDTYLRSTFTLSTPMFFSGMVARGIEQLSPEHRERYLYYAHLYKEFMRPLLPACKMYHHAPVNSRRGVTSGGWFAQEYAAPDRSKSWAVLVHMGETDTDTYVFRPRGLDPGKTYRVTFDSAGTVATIKGWRLVRDGLAIRLEVVGSSELLLFEAE